MKENKNKKIYIHNNKRTSERREIEKKREREKKKGKAYQTTTIKNK
jgi:hypothetical protein